MLSAIELANIASGSGAISGSTESAVAITITSLKMPFGKSGLKGLSIALDVNIAFYANKILSPRKTVVNRC